MMKGQEKKESKGKAKKKKDCPQNQTILKMKKNVKIYLTCSTSLRSRWKTPLDIYTFHFYKGNDVAWTSENVSSLQIIGEDDSNRSPPYKCSTFMADHKFVNTLRCFADELEKALEVDEDST